MKKVVALPVLATMVVLLVIQTALPVQTSEAASRITVPRDYPTIQAAINAASPGDTIKVLPGTYTEQLTISKSLTLVGSGSKVTIIKPTTFPDTTVNGDPYIIDVRTGANLNMEGFTVSGLSSSSCLDLTGNFVGINVMEGATLNLDTSTIKDCTVNGIFAEGEATITKTDVNDYRDHGIFGFGGGSTISVLHSNLNAAQNSEIAGQIGILLVFDAQGIIEHNKISGNLCTLPECGPDYLTQTQAFGIVFFFAGSDSSITNNIISNNDAGIDVIGNSGCCIVDRNVITNSAQNDLFFGVVVQDGENTISNTKITGRNVVVGVLAVAFDTDTVATLDRVLIKGATTPTQELPVGATAEVIFAR